MTTATDHAGELFTRLALSDERFGLPPHVCVVATDIDDPAPLTERPFQKRWPIVVVDADGGQTLVSPVSRVERILDRLRGRDRVRVAVRGPEEETFHFRGRTDRATLQRELFASA